MSGPAATPPKMTAVEFLTWDDGTSMAYKLVDGRPLPRYARSWRGPIPPEVAPPTARHGAVIANAGTEIGARLKGHRPCGAAVVAAVWVNDENVYIADVVATCTPPTGDAVCVPDPFLIVEILSDTDRGRRLHQKVDGYMALPSVREIWLLDSRRRWLRHHRRLDETRWVVQVPLTGPATFESPTLGGEPVALDRLYRNTGL